MRTRATHSDLDKVAQTRPNDYTDYGGSITRWATIDGAYPDCSMGCRHYVPIDGALGADWGVCANPASDRAGLLTFEHQAGGGGCYAAPAADGDADAA